MNLPQVHPLAKLAPRHEVACRGGRAPGGEAVEFRLGRRLIGRFVGANEGFDLVPIPVHHPHKHVPRHTQVVTHFVRHPLQFERAVAQAVACGGQCGQIPFEGLSLGLLGRE